MMASRRQGAGKVNVVVQSMAGAELASVDMQASTSVADLRDHIARSLGLYPFAFDLISVDDGTKLQGSAPLSEHCRADGGLDLTLLKLAVPRANSSRFLRLQSSVPEDAKPTYHGREGSGWATVDVVGPRLLLFVVTLFIAMSFLEASFIRLLALYVVYIVEALFFNAASRGLRSLGDTGSILGYIQRVKSWRPLPKIEAKCWHWETVTRTVTDSEGRTRTETSQEKAYTQTFTETLRVSEWTDTSGEVVQGLHYFPLLQIHFACTWEAGDEQTKQEHDRQRLAVQARAQAADHEHDWSEFLKLGDENGAEFELPHTDMIGATADRLPGWLGWNQYVVATVFGLSWPYRWWLSQSSIKGDFNFHKLVRFHAG